MDSEIQVFINYARDDERVAKRLYEDLRAAGLKPWIDVEDLLPGQNWKTEIRQAIRNSRFFLALFSSKSISREGYLHIEIKQVTSILQEFPSEDIFLIPIRLDECQPPEYFQRYQWVDLFPSYENGLSRILKALLPHKSEVKMPLNEVKLLLVGQGSVGKTSLVRRLVEDQFNPQESQTNGINVRKWWITANSMKFRLNIWDFGGQEIMHATHQFFLTRRSLYLLVLDCRLEEQENRIEYWLKIIQSFGGDSPVIIVGNKADQRHLDIDRRGLQLKYSNVKAIVETSCQSGLGIDPLRTMIENEVSKLEHVHSKLLTTWFNVKNDLENMEEDFIPYSEYQKICASEGITDDISQQTLVRYLHDLGIVLNFQDDPRLEDTNILNPEWVTVGVYNIINSNELFQKKGVLEISDLPHILDSKTYPRHKHMFIIDIMRKFELCFDFEGFTNQKFLVPDLLPREEPYTGDWINALAFQYHYNILPNSIISRFIVRMHSYIYQNTYWRTGVVLAHGNNKALVKADIEDRKMYIRIIGPNEERRDLLTIIRSHFDTIHSTIPGIEVEEKVSLQEDSEIVVGYEHLLRLEHMGIDKYIPEGLGRKIRVEPILNNIESKEERRRRRMVRYPTQRRSGSLDKALAGGFGLLFICVLLAIAVLIPNPTTFQVFIFRVVLSLTASGVGAVIPGFINVEMKKENLFLLRAGGAIALFLIVYLMNPPALVAS